MAATERVVARQPGIAVERLGVGGVQLHALAGQQVVVDGVAGERVPERVAAAAAVDQQQRGVHRLAQRLVQLARRHLGDRGEQPLGHPAARRRRPCAAAAARAGQPLRAGEQHVAQRRRQLVLAAPSRTVRTSSSTKNALPSDRSKHAGRPAPRGGPAPRMAAIWAATSAAAEPLQLEALDAAQPLPARQQRAQRRPAVDLVGAVGEHQQHPRALQRADEEGDEVEGGAVGPVQVLDDQHERPLRAEPAEHAEHQFEQLRGAAGRRRGARRRRPAPGSSRASSRRAGPSTRSSSAPDVVRTSVRSASTSGTSGRPSPPSSMQPPVSTRTPSVTGPNAASSSRLLPTPASPPTSTTPGSPAVVRATAARSRSSSRARAHEDGADDVDRHGPMLARRAL